MVPEYKDIEIEYMFNKTNTNGGGTIEEIELQTFQDACLPCPIGAVCNKEGIKIPHAMKNYWRAKFHHPNLDAYPYFKCPFPDVCLGGNSINGSCKKGYDENGPACATVCIYLPITLYLHVYISRDTYN